MWWGVWDVVVGSGRVWRGVWKIVVGSVVGSGECGGESGRLWWGVGDCGGEWEIVVGSVEDCGGECGSGNVG